MPPFDNAELEYEVGGCHLESPSSREVRAFAEDRSRNRDGRVGAGRGSGPKSQRMPIERGLSLRSRQLISRCETTARMTADSAKPSTRGHRISHPGENAMPSAFNRAVKSAKSAQRFVPVHAAICSTCNSIWSAVRRIDSFGPQHKILGAMRQLRSHKRRPQRSGFLWPAR
jgi:hypothetical protein